MRLHKKISTTGLPIWPLFLAVIVAGLLNYYSVPFFIGSELIFGNVIAVIVLFVYGLVPAVIVSVVAGIAAYFNWGYVFNILPFLFEILALHWATKTQRNPVYFGMLYWALIGWVIVVAEVVLFSDFNFLLKYAITIKYVINGLLNVFIGYVIAQYIMSKTMHGDSVRKQRISVLLTNQLFYIVVITVIGISFFWLKSIEHEKLSDYQERLKIKASYVSIDLEQHMIGHQKSLILSALNINNVSDPVEIQEVLQNLKDVYPSILTLLSADENGLVIATAPKRLLSKITLSGQLSVADRPYYYEVKENGKPFVSNVFQGRGFGIEPIIAIAVPLENDKGFIGIIEASVDLELLKTLDKKEISADEGVIILGPGNRVIYASDDLNYQFLTDLSESKLLQHLLAPEDYFILDEMGNSLIVQSADSDFLGWTIISTIPRSVYDASISVYITITLSLLGLFIIFSFYLARWVARIVTKPINTLSSVLSEAEHAEDLLDINLTGGNQELLEIANVQQKLNEFAVRSRQLMSDLKKANNNQDIANEQLLDLNVNLEKIVASKTKELKIALTKANDASDEAEQAAHAKADFLATMSHEIRTPMNGVLGTAELLNVTSLTVTQKEYVDTILRSGNLLLTIINEILDFSKLEAGKVELEIVPFDLEHLLHQILEVMGRSLTKNIELILDYPATIPNVFRGDPSRLSQVFFNLVDNAIKFTERGSVTIVVRFEGQTLSVEIRDTGIGITEEQKKTLFRSFNQADTSTTRKYGGTGLGLAISKNLINLMNGEITIESEYGKQTNFIITLNLAAEIKPEPEKIFDEIIILIVESNAEHFTMYADLLHYYGASVDQCLEIESLTDTLVYRIAKGSRVDLVLISDNISADDERKYGTELRDHAKLKDIPIVILSPASNKASLQHYFASGFSAYLTKPIRSDLFVSVLSASLENKDATSLITNHSLPNHSQSDSIDIQFSGHILLVEDVLTNQIVAKTMLSNMGLTVDLAEDGLQAIANWKKNHYDLIFMDCRMPNMDGYQATRHIRTKEHSRKTPIIALTANVTEKDRAKCFEAGMDAMVTKPFKPSDLQKALSKWLDSEAKTIIDSGKGQSEPVATSVIDHEMFEETQQALGDAFPKLVDSIFADADKIFEKLSNWTDYLDNEGLAIFPHSLKSASAYIGATKLNQLAYDCESDARAGNVEKALSYLSEMNAAYEDVIRELALLGYDKHG